MLYTDHFHFTPLAVYINTRTWEIWNTFRYYHRVWISNISVWVMFSINRIKTPLSALTQQTVFHIQPTLYIHECRIFVNAHTKRTPPLHLVLEITITNGAPLKVQCVHEHHKSTTGRRYLSKMTTNSHCEYILFKHKFKLQYLNHLCCLMIIIYIIVFSMILRLRFIRETTIKVRYIIILYLKDVNHPLTFTNRVSISYFKDSEWNDDWIDFPMIMCGFCVCVNTFWSVNNASIFDFSFSDRKVDLVLVLYWSNREKRKTVYCCDYSPDDYFHNLLNYFELWIDIWNTNFFFLYKFR